jgi:hypothetical protein
MRTIATIAIVAVAAFFLTANVTAPAEAKTVHPPKVAKNFGKQVGKTVRNTGRTINSAARWSGNAVWVGTGLGWGHARVTNNCTYYYKRYQETRDAKWKNQYNACIR